nr:hypothetical protein Iba_chr13cCG9040 [Ipomoea batatas]
MTDSLLFKVISFHCKNLAINYGKVIRDVYSLSLDV